MVVPDTAVSTTVQGCPSGSQCFELQSPSPQSPPSSSLSIAVTKSSKYYLQTRIISALQQLGIKTMTMKPIRSQSALFTPLNELKNDLIILFELQKLYAEILYELEVVRAQYTLYKSTDTTTAVNTTTASQAERGSNTTMSNYTAMLDEWDSAYTASLGQVASFTPEAESSHGPTKKKSFVRSKGKAPRSQCRRRERRKSNVDISASVSEEFVATEQYLRHSISLPTIESENAVLEKTSPVTVSSENPIGGRTLSTKNQFRELDFETPHSVTRRRHHVDDGSLRDDFMEDDDNREDNDFGMSNEDDDMQESEDQ